MTWYLAQRLSQLRLFWICLLCQPARQVLLLLDVLFEYCYQLMLSKPDPSACWNKLYNFRQPTFAHVTLMKIIFFQIVDLVEKSSGWLQKMVGKITCRVSLISKFVSWLYLSHTSRLPPAGLFDRALTIPLKLQGGKNWEYSTSKVCPWRLCHYSLSCNLSAHLAYNSLCT